MIDLNHYFDTPRDICLETARKAVARRKALRITQKELAGMTGVSFASVRRFETTGQISFESLVKIAIALDMKEDIKLDINGSYLTISAEHNTTNEDKDNKGNYIRRERSYGSFKRSFDITDVDENAISAEYKNGILIIDLPKRKPEQPVSKRLEIK